jgi:hypothetical protein
MDRIAGKWGTSEGKAHKSCFSPGGSRRRAIPKMFLEEALHVNLSTD